MSKNTLVIKTTPAESGSEVKKTSELRFKVGDREISDVMECEIHKMELDSVIYATITLAVRLGE